MRSTPARAYEISPDASKVSLDLKRDYSLMGRMLNDQRNIAFIHNADRFSSCIQYVLDLYCQVYGGNYRLVPSDLPEPNLDLNIYYGVEPSGKAKRSLIINRSTFFGRNFGEDEAPPPGTVDLIQTSKGQSFSRQLTKVGPALRLQYDVIASIFYFLSGYHDWCAKKRDEYGRTRASYVELPKETWDTPIVHQWLRQLNELFDTIITGDVRPAAPKSGFPEQQTICITHDVDLLRKYRRKTLPRHLIRSLRGGAAKEELRRAKAVLNGQERDPYDCFERFYTVKERVSAHSTFFFMGCPPSPKDGDYRVDDRDVKDIIVRAKTFGDEIGVHGSWESAENPSTYLQEKQAVEKAAGITVVGNRQHYLRFNNPKTWQGLVKAGVRYDATGGFPDRCGFKNGWSGCYQPFDLDEMRPLKIIAIPLVCMDVTLANYEKIPAELALERMTNLLDAACDNIPGGAFTFLWHNTMGDNLTFPGYWDTFEYFFSVASGAARFITLSQLCDEYESRISNE